MNLKALAQKVDLDEKDYLEMIDLFIETSHVHLLKLEMAIKRGDVKKMVESAHSIKGSAASLGLTVAYEVAKELETEARAHDLPRVVNTYQSLKTEMKRIADEIGRERSGGSEGKVYAQVE